jgi:hypothetical protein
MDSRKLVDFLASKLGAILGDNKKNISLTNIDALSLL